MAEIHKDRGTIWLSKEFRAAFLKGKVSLLGSDGKRFKGKTTRAKAFIKVDSFSVSVDAEVVHIKCYAGGLFFGEYRIPDVDFSKGETLTVADIDWRSRIEIT